MQSDDVAGISLLSRDIGETLALLTDEERKRYNELTSEAIAIQEGKKREPRSYREFVDFVSGGRYRWYRYAIVLASVLQRVADGILKRVLIFAPPRHGKSEAVSRLFPAYYLYRHPHHQFGLVSYGAQLANTLARTAREYYQQGTGALQIRGSINYWQTEAAGVAGGMWSAGIGGPLTGRGMDIGDIDDPVKNAEEASSLKKRTRDRDWYQSTFYTRAEPNAAILIMCTRWDLEDLAGWILEQEWENQTEPDALERWHIVNFEAIKKSAAEIQKEEDIDERPAFPPSCTVEPDWRQPGEALAPERYPLETLLRIKRRIGDYFFNALYQQRPRLREGQRFTLEMLEVVPDFPREGITGMIRWWDEAATEEKKARRTGADFTAGALILRHKSGIYYFVDLVHGQWSDLKRNQIIRATAESDKQLYGGLVKTWGEEEPGRSGVDAAKHFRRLLDGFTVYTEKTTGDKEHYIGPLASTAGAGNFKLVRGSWNAVARREFLDYPGKHEDIVEAAARATSKLALRRGTTGLPPSVSQLTY